MEGVVNRLTGREVNEDIQIGQTSIKLCKIEIHIGPLDESIGGTGVTNLSIVERKSKKEQLKCLVDLLADMLPVRKVPEEKWRNRAYSWANVEFYKHLNDIVDSRYPIYPTPPLGQDMTQGQFLSGVWQVWIQSFPSPRLVAPPRLKNLVCPTIYP